MANVIRLERAKPYSTCHGERTPDDPHYKVHFFQAYKVGKKSIVLPFDADGVLVPDDGKKEPYKGLVEGKIHMFEPLYNDDMRALVKKLEEKLPEPERDDDEPTIAGSDNPDFASKGIDLRAWLRGTLPLTMQEVRSACKSQHGLNPQNFREAIEFLVEDLNLVRIDELGERVQKYMGK